LVEVDRSYDSSIELAINNLGIALCVFVAAVSKTRISGVGGANLSASIIDFESEAVLVPGAFLLAFILDELEVSLGVVIVSNSSTESTLSFLSLLDHTE
jgi:hypothetical protein